MRILVLNGGSSSLKCALYELAGADPVVQPECNEPVDWSRSDNPASLLDSVLLRAGTVDAVGHRIVHGGPNFRTPVRVTAEVRATIAAQAELTPEHNRLELAA